MVTNVQNYDFNLSDFYAASHTLSSQSKPFDIVLYFFNNISTTLDGDGDGQNYDDGDDIGASM